MRIMLGDTPVTLTGDSLTITEIIPNQEITITYYYTPTWRDVGRLVNTAAVTAGDATDTDTVTVRVDDGWTPNIPDDDDEDVEPDVEVHAQLAQHGRPLRLHRGATRTAASARPPTLPERRSPPSSSAC